MASTFAGGTLRVTTPASYDAQRASRTDPRPARRSRSATAASKDALVAALGDAVSSRSSGST